MIQWKLILMESQTEAEEQSNHNASSQAFRVRPFWSLRLWQFSFYWIISNDVISRIENSAYDSIDCFSLDGDVVWFLFQLPTPLLVKLTSRFSWSANDIWSWYVCRIFQFENFKRTKKRALEEDDVDGALVRFKYFHRGEISFWNSYESDKEKRKPIYFSTFISLACRDFLEALSPSRTRLSMWQLSISCSCSLMYSLWIFFS